MIGESSAPNRRKSRKKPGPKPQVTQEIFVRVCEAFAHGLPLSVALESEGIARATWHNALKADPQFGTLFRQCRALYLAQFSKYMANHQDWRARAWQAERRFQDLFKKEPEVEVNQTNVTNINGLPADLLKRAQELAKQRTAPAKAAGSSNS